MTVSSLAAPSYARPRTAPPSRPRLSHSSSSADLAAASQTDAINAAALCARAFPAWVPTGAASLFKQLITSIARSRTNNNNNNASSIANSGANASSGPSASASSVNSAVAAAASARLLIDTANSLWKSKIDQTVAGERRAHRAELATLARKASYATPAAAVVRQLEPRCATVRLAMLSEQQQQHHRGQRQFGRNNGDAGDGDSDGNEDDEDDGDYNSSDAAPNGGDSMPLSYNAPLTGLHSRNAAAAGHPRAAALLGLPTAVAAGCGAAGAGATAGCRCGWCRAVRLRARLLKERQHRLNSRHGGCLAHSRSRSRSRSRGGVCGGGCDCAGGLSLSTPCGGLSGGALCASRSGPATRLIPITNSNGNGDGNNANNADGDNSGDNNNKTAAFGEVTVSHGNLTGYPLAAAAHGHSAAVHPDSFDRTIVTEGPSGVAIPRYHIVSARSPATRRALDRSLTTAAAAEAGLSTPLDGREWRSGQKSNENDLYGPGTASGSLFNNNARGGHNRSGNGGSGSSSNFAAGNASFRSTSRFNGKSKSNNNNSSGNTGGSGDSAADSAVLHAALATVEELSKQCLRHESSAAAAQSRLKAVDSALASMRAAYRAAAAMAVRRITAAGEHLADALMHGSAVFIDTALVMAAQVSNNNGQFGQSNEAGVFAGRFAGEARRWQALVEASVRQWRAEVEAETIPPGAGVAPAVESYGNGETGQAEQDPSALLSLQVGNESIRRVRSGYEELLDREGRPHSIPITLVPADADADANRDNAIASSSGGKLAFVDFLAQQKQSRADF